MIPGADRTEAVPGADKTEAAPASPPALRFEGASRIHGTGVHSVTALHPTSFDVMPGEFVAIMGPSGSGKSTLLSMAGTLDRPTSGRVFLHGHDLGTRSARALAELRRRVIGFVFQDLNLLPGLTAIENVSLPLELDGMPLGKTREAALEALRGVRVDALADRFPDNLSGGEQQRVAIARAVVGPRSILLADEPTGALDSVTGELVMRLLRTHCDAGRTVILVTHDAAHAAWADRILFLKDGHLVNETRPVRASVLAPVGQRG